MEESSGDEGQKVKNKNSDNGTNSFLFIEESFSSPSSKQKVLKENFV